RGVPGPQITVRAERIEELRFRIVFGSGRRPGIEALVAGVEPAVLGAAVPGRPHFLPVVDAQAPDDVVAVNPTEGKAVVPNHERGTGAATDFRGPRRLVREPMPVGPAGWLVGNPVAGRPSPVRPVRGQGTGGEEQGDKRAAHHSPRRTSRPDPGVTSPGRAPRPRCASSPASKPEPA